MLAITLGEPAGIGPDLFIKLAQQPRTADWVVIGDPDLLHSRARLLNLPLELTSQPTRRPGQTQIKPVRLAAKAQPGRLDPANAPGALAALDHALEGCLAGRFRALVTGPMQKSVINEAGIPFTGHTEYLRERCGVDAVLMLLVSGDLRVALATTHLPLAAVPTAITRDLLEASLRLLLDGLQRLFGIPRPRVLVTGLNPHAGESGHLGREEIEVIAPACERLRASGQAVTGPVAADTAFTPAALSNADAVLAMYHDQGLPVLKHAGFGAAVNVTLGLPFLRTSVDHGTALELAGAGNADAGSLLAALHLADRLGEA